MGGKRAANKLSYLFQVWKTDNFFLKLGCLLFSPSAVLSFFLRVFLFDQTQTWSLTLRRGVCSETSLFSFFYWQEVIFAFSAGRTWLSPAASVGFLYPSLKKHMYEIQIHTESSRKCYQLATKDSSLKIKYCSTDHTEQPAWFPLLGITPYDGST